MPRCFIRRGKPLGCWGDTETGLTSSQPRLQQEGREESSRKRGTHYLCGLNMGLGNSRGIGKNQYQVYRKKSQDENKRRLFQDFLWENIRQSVTPWLSSEQCLLSQDTVIAKARTCGVKDQPSPFIGDTFIQKYGVQLSDERGSPQETGWRTAVHACFIVKVSPSQKLGHQRLSVPSRTPNLGGGHISR